MTPECMTPAEFSGWTDANATLRRKAPSPCYDCPLSFAREMRAAGCCNGKPGGTGGVGGRPRLSDYTVAAYVGRGSKYPTEADRLAARRQQWREGSARRRAS